jgi:hypothetical protein
MDLLRVTDPRAEWNTPALTTDGQNNHAVRTEQWRYIRYPDGGEELYDEQEDSFEWTNLAGARSKFDAAKKELSKHLPAVNKPAVKRPNAGQSDSRHVPRKGRHERRLSDAKRANGIGQAIACHQGPKQFKFPSMGRARHDPCALGKDPLGGIRGTHR